MMSALLRVLYVYVFLTRFARHNIWSRRFLAVLAEAAMHNRPL